MSHRACTDRRVYLLVRRVARVVLPVACVGALTLSPSAAVADVGVGVSAATLGPKQPLAAGSRTQLSWWVQNTGSQASSFRLAAVPHRTAGHEAMPVTWLTMHSPIDLPPGAHDVVPVVLSVPAGAAPGEYSAYLVATAATDNQRNASTSVGAAAATAVEVAVTDPHPAATSRVELALLGVTGLLGLGSFLTGGGLRKPSAPGPSIPVSARTGRST